MLWITVLSVVVVASSWIGLKAVGKTAAKALPPEPVDRAEKVRRVLKHVTRKKIGELLEGEAAVLIGVAQPLPGAVPLTSPLQQQPCIAYHVEQRATDLTQTLVHENASCSDFLLRDDSGEVLVRGMKLDFAVAIGPWVERLLRDANGHTMLHREALLLPGAEVAVCGALVMRSLPASGNHERTLGTESDYRESNHRMELVATPTFPAVASTDDDLIIPPDQQISPAQLRR